MTIRPMMLPDGWYPHNEKACREHLDDYFHHSSCVRQAVGAVLPHAGWAFCGPIMAAGIAPLKEKPSSIVLFAGHMPAHNQGFIFREDAFATPLGKIENNRPLINSLASLSDLPAHPDDAPDNTSEVVLPFVRYRFPDIPLLIVRLPTQINSLAIAEEIALNAPDAVFLGSTDLTHYGPHYGFTPAGTGPDALEWARENDRRLIDLLLNTDGNRASWDHIIQVAEKERSACSISSAVCALHAAKAAGASQVREEAYTTSREANPSVGDANAVGYVALTASP